MFEQFQTFPDLEIDVQTLQSRIVPSSSLSFSLKEAGTHTATVLLIIERACYFGGPDQCCRLIDEVVRKAALPLESREDRFEQSWQWLEAALRGTWLWA